MGYPRSRVVDSSRPGWFHCISRCTRRLFLCGDAYGYRKQWIERRLALLVDVCAVELGAHAILSNHLHLVLRTDPDRARKWSAREVVERWARLHPRRIELATAEATSRAEAQRLKDRLLSNLAHNADWVETWRRRLASLSWFNKLLKEPIARRANREDDVTGHFWEGRFKCIPLLSEGAILACMVYVDLNPIRAKLAAALQDVRHASIAQRLEASSARRRRPVKRMRRLEVRLLPIESIFRLTTRQYVSLVGATAERARTRSGDQALRSVAIDPRRWTDTIGDTIRWFGTAIGRTRDLLDEAVRRDTRRVVNPLPIFVE